MESESKDLFHQVLGRISDLPGAGALMDSLNGVRERLDDMQKRLRGLDALEQRVKALERRVDELAAGPKPVRRVTTPRKTSPAKPRASRPEQSVGTGEASAAGGERTAGAPSGPERTQAAVRGSASADA
jgi:hypothetical protein